MKICLFKNDIDEWVEDESREFEVIELPDAIVTEFRALHARLKEIGAYFDDTAQPLIDAAYKQRQEQWAVEHPEEANARAVAIDRFGRTLFGTSVQASIFSRPLGVLGDGIIKGQAEDVIIYDDKPYEKK
jgi:hypothetical protein